MKHLEVRAPADSSCAPSSTGWPSRQKGLGLGPAASRSRLETVGHGPPCDWHGFRHPSTSTFPQPFQEATRLPAIRPPPGLTDVDLGPIGAPSAVPAPASPGSTSAAGAPLDLETSAADLSHSFGFGVRPPPGLTGVDPEPINASPAASAGMTAVSPSAVGARGRGFGPAASAPPGVRIALRTPASRLAAPSSLQALGPWLESSGGSPGVECPSGLGKLNFAEYLLGQEQQPQIPMLNSEPSTSPEAQEPCKALRFLEMLKLAQAQHLAWLGTSCFQERQRALRSDSATPNSANDFLFPKQDSFQPPTQASSSPCAHLEAAAPGLQSPASPASLELASPEPLDWMATGQTAGSQKALSGAIGDLRQSAQSMLWSFAHLRLALGQPRDLAPAAAGAVEEPGAGERKAAHRSWSVAPLGPAPGARRAPPPGPRLALLWCSRSTRKWGDDSEQRSELLSGLRYEACGLRSSTFPSATQFSRWLFAQERGLDVVPWSVLIVGWREAKPCVKAIDAAATGKDGNLREDSRRILRRASEGPGDVRVAVGMVIILAEHDSTVERAGDFLKCRIEDHDENDLPLLVLVKVARSLSELRVLLDDAAHSEWCRSGASTPA